MEHLDQIIKKFNVSTKNFEYSSLTNGLINDTYLVSTNNSPLYVLQKINTNVFPEIDALTNNIVSVLPELDDDSYFKISLENTLDGYPFYKEKDSTWRLMTFVPESKVYNTTSSFKVAFEAGKIIGLFHALLSNFKVGNLQETIIDFHNISHRFEQFKVAKASAKTSTLKNAEDLVVFVESNIDLLLKIKEVKLPLRVCHNDTKLNNILFSQEDKALCLIDLDTIMPGLFLYDFGDAIRTIVNKAPEDEINIDLINFNRQMFEEFVKGLASSGLELHEEEIDLLHLGPILMPFLHGIRALTDYLENNKYYKVKYENQNLDRSRSLFQFSKLAIENQDFMKTCIKKHLRQ